MSVTWGSRWGMFWTNSKLLKTGWLSAALIVAFYVGAIRPAQQARLIANTKATGLSAGPVSVDMSRAWRQTRIGSFMERDRVAGIIGGVAGRNAGGDVQRRQARFTASSACRRCGRRGSEDGSHQFPRYGCAASGGGGGEDSNVS